MTSLFYWQNEPIQDINVWAKEHGERMVEVTFRVRNVNPYAGKNAISYYEEKEIMPESFFKTLRMTNDRVAIKYKTI